MAPRKRSRRRKSHVLLTEEKGREVIALYREGGGSFRQLAAAVGVSKSTLYDWVTGPLQQELEKILKTRSEPATVEEQDDQEIGVLDDIDQCTPVAGEGDVENYRPDLKFGGIKTSLGHREPGVPGVEIRYTHYGAALCCRCAKALPGGQREIRFLRVEGKWRPCCLFCKRDGEILRPWPAMPGEVLHVPAYRTH